MEAFMSFVGAIAIIAALFWGARAIIAVWKEPIPYAKNNLPHVIDPQKESRRDLMDEGDVHSGPHGYSPNTAYPDTQYGSGFDDEAEWNR